MKLSPPIKNIMGVEPIAPYPSSIYISQKFGNVWISQIDQTINGIKVKKGENVYKKIFGMEGHNGVDIAAPRGTPIYAGHSGYIVEAVTGSDYGIRVCLYFEDGGKEYMLIHGHLDNFKPLPKITWNLKNKSNPVKVGDKIGEVDSTGFSTGDHLHWGLYEYKNGVKLNSNNGYQGCIDPWQFVKGDNMQLVKDGNTIYLTGGINVKFKVGISDLYTLGIFGDEPIDTGDLSKVKSEYTLSQGFVITKK